MADSPMKVLWQLMREAFKSEPHPLTKPESWSQETWQAYLLNEGDE